MVECLNSLFVFGIAPSYESFQSKKTVFEPRVDALLMQSVIIVLVVVLVLVLEIESADIASRTTTSTSTSTNDQRPASSIQNRGSAFLKLRHQLLYRCLGISKQHPGIFFDK